MPELVPIRYGRMLVSPFTFFRGAAAVMAADLGATPRSGIEVQLCGDAHIANFGGFAAPDRQLVFDLNDFDETLPGPWEWDVKRMAVEHRDRGTRARAGSRAAGGAGGGARVPQGHARLRRARQPRGLVRAHGPAGAAGPLRRAHRRDDRQDAQAHRREGAAQGQRARADQAHPPRRRAAALHQRAAAAGADRGAAAAQRGRARDRAHEHADRELRELAPRRPRPPAQQLPLRAHRAQGRRRRQRRHARLDHPARGSRRHRPARAAGQGGGRVGARALRRAERVRDARPARGRGPAADAGRERHLPRLGVRHRRRRRAARLLRPPALGLEGLGRPRRP